MRVFFMFFWKISAYKTCNHKISTVAERLDPWRCSLEVKSSWVDFGGCSGVVKFSGYYGFNVVIFQLFYFSGCDIFTTDSLGPLRWQGRLLEKLNF